MQWTLLTIVAILGSVIIIVEIIALSNLYKISKRGKDNKVIQDKRYLELNLKFQYLQTLIVVGGISLVFLGWNVKSQVAEELKFDIRLIKEEQIDSINRKIEDVNKSIVQLENRRDIIQKEIETLTSENEQLKKKHTKLNDEIGKRTADIETLLRIYIVSDIPYKVKNLDTLYYKNLPRPINAKKLPDFRKPPVINIQSTSDIHVSIDTTTTDYFVFKSGFAGVETEGTLTLWIVDRY